MLIVKAGGGKRRLAQMERTRELLAPSAILRAMSEDELRRLLHEETMIVEFEPVDAKRSLPRLVRTAAERQKMHALFDALDADPHLDDRQRTLLAELRKLLPVGGAAAARESRGAGPARPAASRRRGTSEATIAA